MSDIQTEEIQTELVSGVVDGHVYLPFEKPICWLRLTPAQAWKLGKRLIADAEAAEEQRLERLAG